MRATWQPADSWRTVGGAMILRAGVAEMGSGGGGADGCHMAITSSQRCHVQHISIAFNYLSFPMLIPQYLGTITSRSQDNLPAVKQNIHTETEAQTKTSPILPDI